MTPSPDSSISSSPESADPTDLHAHRFGASPPLSVGVEEELLLVDRGHEPLAASEAALDAVPAPFADRVSSEIFAEQIELKTGVCHDIGVVLRELTETRQAIQDAGFEMLGSGLHPAAARERPSWSPSRATR